MKKERIYFGTDGIRGKANAAPMTADTALRLGQAAGQIFVRGDHRHRVVIAKDTRLSGYMLEPALTAGFISVGMDVILVGPMPTPAVAMLTRSLRADLGVMLSASHNPYYDNGIKLFGPDGYKLSDDTEYQIETLMQSGDIKLAESDKLGRAKRLEDAKGRYIESVKNSFPAHLSLEGLKIIVDCANGAAYDIAPAVLFELGAEVISLGVKPDGFNINAACGSTSPEALCRAVVEHKADLGIALDGDADRLAICDEYGKLIDGDQLMAMIAGYWHEKGRLGSDTVVATDMSNLGMERHLNKMGLKLLRTQIGDRYVMEAMRKYGYRLGGEQSGHIIMSDYSSTGDGLIAGLQAIAVMLESKQKMSVTGNVFTPMPQILHNIRFAKGSKPLENAQVKAVIEQAKADLGNQGRILVRKSGTEPLIRIMVEAEQQAMLDKTVKVIAEAIVTSK